MRFSLCYAFWDLLFGFLSGVGLHYSFAIRASLVSQEPGSDAVDVKEVSAFEILDHFAVVEIGVANRTGLLVSTVIDVLYARQVFDFALAHASLPANISVSGSSLDLPP